MCGFFICSLSGYFCFIEAKITAQLQRRYVVESLNGACVAYKV
jgi:hypothetical protein